MPLTTISGPAGSLRVDDGGSGSPPVLFIHGNGGDLSLWRAQLDHVRRRRRAVAMDLRGFGASDPPPDGDYSMVSLAHDVGAVIDARVLDPVVLVGHSLGGTVALAFAGSHPTRAAGLVLVDPPGDLSRLPRAPFAAWLDLFSPARYGAQVERYFDRMLAGSAPGVRDLVIDVLRSTRREAVVGAIEGLVDFDPVPALHALTRPRLSVVTPENDGSDSLHAIVASLPHRVVAGASHWLMMDRPDDFNAVLDELLRSCG